MWDLHGVLSRLCQPAILFRASAIITGCAFGVPQIKLLFGDFYQGNNKIFCYANGIKSNDYKVINGDREFVYDLIVVEEEKESTVLNENIIHLDIDFIFRYITCNGI